MKYPDPTPHLWRCLCAALFLSLCFTCSGLAQKPDSTQGRQSQSTAEKSDQNERKVPLYARNKLTLGDINTSAMTDKRVIVMMAALNIAGYDYEPGNRQLSSLRQQLREDLKNINPEIARKLRNYYLSHKKDRTEAASVAPYLSLALSLSQPPAFSLETAAEQLPEDVREIIDFTLLLEEFYQETTFSRLLPRYMAAYERALNDYGPLTAKVAGMTLSYLHTEPILELPPLYVPRITAQKESSGRNKDKTTQEIVQESLRLPMRERRFVVMPDLLNAAGTANLRVIRDTYYLLFGHYTTPNEDAVRLAFLKFVIDPMTARMVKEVRAISGDLKKLRDTRGDNLADEYKGEDSSAFYLITDSLVRAINERIALLDKIYSGKYADAKALRQAVAAAEEEAIYHLSLAYERGSVLVYHFYDQMKAYEDVGINLKDYQASMLDPDNINFAREARRLEEYQAKIANFKAYQAEKAARPIVPATISNADPQIALRLNEADEMIKTRQYDDARAMLEAIYRERPDNARALFGLAEVTSKKAQAITDSARLAEELYAAVEFYKQAAQHASPETEKWLAQRSYVAAGKILEFLTDLSDASSAFEMAIRLGDVPNGAYQDALTGKQRIAQKIRQ